MNHVRPIYWHEGLFLRPQHFQQHDLFSQSYAYLQSAMLQPHAWGVRKLSLVQSALNNQIFEIDQFEAVFSDGSLVRFPGNARLPRRSIEGMWDVSGKPMSVYLGLRGIAPGRNNVAAESNVAPDERREADRLAAARFAVGASATMTADLFMEDKQDEVYFLDYNLEVFVDDEAAKAVDFQLIKVAELQRLGAEVKVLPQFIPPLMHVGASPVLGILLREIKEQLTARGRELALYKQDRGLENVAMGSRDMLYLLALLSLNRYIPLLHHWLDDMSAHPWQFYGVLRQLAGELSTFSAVHDVFGAMGTDRSDELPPYQHDNLGACFGAAVTLIVRLLDELTAGPDFQAPLLFDGTYFGAEISERALQGANQYYLRVRSAEAPGTVMADLQSTAKISSRENLPILIARALPGVAAIYDESPPSQLPRTSDSLYFRLDHQSSAWDAIRNGANVAIYFDTVPAEADIELMVLYGK
jgi:type VI secretion system protein ImpJ